jgi:alpha-tubulin suppressor-like RCC1 family protein
MTSNLCCSILCTTVVSKVNNSQTAPTSVDLVLIANAQDNVDTSRSSWLSLQTLVSCGCAASVPNGHVAFICDGLVPVVSMNNCWIGFDGRPLSYTNGELFLWGSGTGGQLGNGNASARCVPIPEITKDTTWCQVRLGSAHTTAIKTSGALWLWGFNSCGQLGISSTQSQSSPVREITSSTNWCVASAWNHTAAIKTDGTLWVWGNNNCGNLGTNSTTPLSSPVREISSSSNWCSVTTGGCVTAAIKTTGTLWLWGTNNCGNLGNNSILQRSSPVQEITSSTTWTQVSIGVFPAVAALKSDGTLWTWGSNFCGMLGTNSTVDRSSPVREISSNNTWCQVCVGIAHAVALRTNGTLWSWGCNCDGVLGDGTTVDKSSPVQEATGSTTWCQMASRSATLAIKTDGSLWAWGRGTLGQLGLNGTFSSARPRRECRNLNNWCQTSAGFYFSAGLTTCETFILCQ